MEHGFIGMLFIVVALIFIFGGSKKLEDLGKGFGGFMREFNKAKRDGQDEAQAHLDAVATPAPAKKRVKKEKAIAGRKGA
jgi:Sec-independent protein translocase protein TatA